MQCSSCGLDNPPDARFCTRCNAPLTAPIAPVPKIGVGASYNYGWKRLWKHFWILLLIGIIYYLIAAVVLLFDPDIYRLGDILRGFDVVGGGPPGTAIWSTIFSIAYDILLTSPLTYGVAFAFLKAARSEPVKVQDMFEIFRNYWNVVLASLLVSVIVIVGFVLLIVPGIFLGCKLAFAPYLVVDRKTGAIEAIKESWRMTNGYAWKVFLIGLLAIPICIAGYICLFVGIIVALMWVYTAMATLYYAVSSAGQASLQQEVPAS